jgi:hypothetical protein
MLDNAHAVHSAESNLHMTGRGSMRMSELIHGPLAAAVVSVCVIVLSLFGHVMQVQRITNGE